MISEKQKYTHKALFDWLSKNIPKSPPTETWISDSSHILRIDLCDGSFSIDGDGKIEFCILEKLI